MTPDTDARGTGHIGLDDRIAADHHRIEELLTVLERDRADQEACRALVREVSVHSAAEEQVVYPELRRLEGGDGLADSAMLDHQEIGAALSVLDRFDLPSEETRAALDRVAPLLRRHIAEEERHLLVLLRRALGEDHLHDLGRRFQVAKLAAPTRPHPHGPQAHGTLTAAATSVVDEVRDAVEGVPPPEVQVTAATVDRVAMVIGAARTGIGAALLLTPGLAGRIWFGPGSTTPAARLLARVVGARDVALGLATLRGARSVDTASLPMLRLGVAADAADAAATVLAWRTLSPWRRAVMPSVAALVAGAGARAARRLTSPTPR
jgi:hemerythrin superfamily protein